jgi:hypothetical protein
MDAEQFSIEWTGGDAWNKYNPKWLIETMDAEIQNDPDHPDQSKIFDISDVRRAFMDGFKTGVTFKITGEMPREDE